MKRRISVKEIEDWEKIKKENLGKTEIIIFKTSPVCGVSNSADFQLSRWFKKISDDSNIVVVNIDVIFSKQLCAYISDELNIPHESPQLIWLNSDGSVKYNTSHYNITAIELSEHLQK